MKYWHNSGDTLHPLRMNGEINYSAGISIEDGDVYEWSDHYEFLLDGVNTPRQLIEAFEEAIVWLKSKTQPQ